MVDYLRGNDWIPPVLYYYKKFKTDNILEFLLKLEMKYSSAWLLGQTKDKRLVDMCSIIKLIDKNTKPKKILRSDELKYDKSEVEEVLASFTIAQK